MKGMVTYNNDFNFSMNWEVSLFIIPTPPYKHSYNQLVSNNFADYNRHYCFS